MALIGLSIAIHPGNTGQSGTAPGYIAFGCVIVAACIFAIVCQLTNRVVLTQHGLAWRNLMRTRSVAWADVQQVGTAVAASVGRWYSPAVKANGKLIRINSIIGSRRYVESIVADIRSVWTEARTATLAGGVDASAAGPPEV